MSHTPEQARALWCPMVRIARHEFINNPQGTGADHIIGGCNTDALGGCRIPASCRCVAEQCAMWRWEHTTASVQVAVECPGGQRAMTYEQKTVKTHGYCGLAGAHYTS